MRMKISSSKFYFRVAIALMFLPVFVVSSARAQTAADFRGWGMEALNRIETDFALPSRHLYADVITPGKPAPNRPAFMWGCGVELSALVAATKADGKTWKPRLKEYFTGMEVYWQTAKGTTGYNVLPMPSPPDRYYDDNEWIAIALCDAYALTKEKAYLARAEAVMQFVLSAEDDKFGGGIYWKEEKEKQKYVFQRACRSRSAALISDYRQTRLLRCGPANLSLDKPPFAGRRRPVLR